MSEAARQAAAGNGKSDPISTRRCRTRLREPAILSLLCLATLLCGLRVRADDAARWGSGTAQPVPQGAKVTLALDRTDYFLGENVLVHFVLENSGNEPFEASWGGDYRGASRHLRFKVTATDELGKVADDPDPSPNCFGGMGGPSKLQPGEKFTTSLPLMRYCQIDKPGAYTIRAAHDFGWKEGERKRPVGETRITFRMPTAAEAEQVVAQMEKLPSDPSSRWGQRTRDYADFSCLRQRVYLEPIMRRALAGDKRAFDALGCISTPEATQALIGLAGAADAGLALDAARALTGRLPPTGPYKDPPKTRGFDPFAVRRRLAAQTWDPKFAPDVRALAARFLARQETSHVSMGAVIFDAVGTKDDAPALLAALDRALETTCNPRHDPKDNILDLPQPIRELLGAMQALRSRGFALGESRSGNAQLLLYFDEFVNEPPPRPRRWPEMLDAFGTAGQYPLREAALRSIPQPVPAECVPLVRRGLADCDLGVCRAACAVAGRSGNKDFLKPLVEIIATEQHEWLLREASDAARKLGAGSDFLETWAERLGDEHLCALALDALQTVLEVPGSNSGRTDLSRAERLELRTAWKAFLALHAQEIRDGKRFKLSDPAVTPALVGRARSWQLPGGTSWPPVPADTAAPR